MLFPDFLERIYQDQWLVVPFYFIDSLLKRLSILDFYIQMNIDRDLLCSYVGLHHIEVTSVLESRGCCFGVLISQHQVWVIDVVNFGHLWGHIFCSLFKVLSNYYSFQLLFTNNLNDLNMCFYMENKSKVNSYYAS